MRTDSVVCNHSAPERSGFNSPNFYYGFSGAFILIGLGLFILTAQLKANRKVMFYTALVILLIGFCIGVSVGFLEMKSGFDMHAT